MIPLLTTAYLPPVSYIAQLFAASHAEIEACDHYAKRTYRNRCHLVGADGVIALSVPVEKPHAGKCLTRDMLISSHGNWQHLHTHAIMSAYSNSPFYEYYWDDFRPLYEHTPKYLFDFNNELLTRILALLDIPCTITYTSQYHPEGTPAQLDLRQQIHPRMASQEIIPGYRTQPYYQVFASRLGFTPDASVLDLLFNMGPESLLLLKASI